MEDVRTWLEIADGSPWWPDVLRYPIPPGVTEQQVIAGAMRAGGAAWSDELRAAIELVLDRVAWDDIRSVRPERRAHGLEREQLREHLRAAEQALADSRPTVEWPRRAGRRARRGGQPLDAQVAALNVQVTGLTAEAAALDLACRDQQRAVAAAEASTLAARAATEAARREGVRVQAELHDARAQLRAYQARLARTLASTSWRITAPMRALKSALTART